MSVPDANFITEEDRNVCIGGQYNGDTVTKLDEEVTDLGHRIRTRKMITVKSGIIYKLDLFVDKKADKKTDEEVKEEKKEKLPIPTKKNSIPTKQTSKDTILSTTSTVKTSGGGLSSAQSVPDDIDTPPPSPPPLPDVNIRDVPKEFENGKSVPITVFPKSDLDNINIGGTTGGGGIGEWRYPKGKETKDDHFLPQEIDLYYGNDEPLFPSADGAAKDDDESSMSSFGLWGLDAGDDAPHQSWTRSSRNICFPPGMEPSGDVDILGRWVYSPENKYTGAGDNKKWPPPTTKSAWVFPRKDKYDEDFDPSVPSQGIWKSKDNSFEDVNWQPQQVDLFNNDDDSLTSSLDESLPHGYWGIKEDAKPDLDTNKFPPNKLWFYPPGEEPEPDCIVKGRWCMPNNNIGGRRGVGKLNVKWPPPEVNVAAIGSAFHGSISSASSSGSVEIPVVFENGKVPIKVFPRSSFPSKSDSDTSGSKTKKKVRFDLIGQWSYPDGQEENDDHWMPQTVDLYLGDNEPPYPHSEESSMSSYGLWGTRRSGTPTRLNSNTSLSSGSISLSLSLDWTPEGSLVFPPGVEPEEEDDVEIHGKWAYPRFGHDAAVKIEWPPPMAQSAWVFPESNVPGVDNNESRGIWRFKNKSDDSHRQWQAKKVQLYTIDENMGDEEADKSKVWGKWGVRRGAEPDEKWNWSPKDLWFYPPKEEPEKDCMVQGSWATDLKTWPPPTRKIGRSLRQVGKLEIPTIESNLASPRRAPVGKLMSPQSGTSSAGGISVGKLKIPTTFGDAASPEQRRKVAKLKIPDKFL